MSVDWGAAANWVTAIATAALAFVAWRQIPLVAEQVKALAQQIKAAREMDAANAERTRVWNTTEACRQIDSDPIFEAASKRIWDASECGTKYEKGKVDERDLIIVLNYLETVAIGVSQGLYVESIVKDHLEPAIKKTCEKIIYPQLVSPGDYEKLVELHERWHPPAKKKPTSFRTQ
jgi:hypothetical protein